MARTHETSFLQMGIIYAMLFLVRPRVVKLSTKFHAAKIMTARSCILGNAKIIKASLFLPSKLILLKSQHCYGILRQVHHPQDRVFLLIELEIFKHAMRTYLFDSSISFNSNTQLKLEIQ